MVTKIELGATDIFLDNYEIGQGKITISDTNYDYNYSKYWGSMGEKTLEEFITSINSDYFASKLMSGRNYQEINIKGTFTNIRKFIKEELGLPYFKHMEFQKDMRLVLKQFESEVIDDRSFVDWWKSSFIDRLDFYLIDDRFERTYIENSFNGICEHWNFIAMKPNREYNWLVKLHKDLKKVLKKKNNLVPELV